MASSHQEDSDIADDYENSELYGEVELLKEIYVNELTLDQDDDWPRCICLLLHPATGDNIDEQWICVTLELRPTKQYPEQPPAITIRNTRGLSDERINSLSCDLHQLADTRRGEPMLYELIELVKESLTSDNLPHGSCVICLEGFTEGDHFVKTECYHYYHSSCLLRYIEHSMEEIKEHQKQIVRHIEQAEKQVVCPVCRIVIEYDLESLRRESTPDKRDIQYVPSPDIKRLQESMAKLYLRQKQKGGIIDIEEESNKYLISLATPQPSSRDPSPRPDPIPADNLETSQNAFGQSVPPAGRGRGRYYNRDRRDNRRPGGRDRDDRGKREKRENYGKREYHNKWEDGGRPSNGRKPPNSLDRDRREIHSGLSRKEDPSGEENPNARVKSGDPVRTRAPIPKPRGGFRQVAGKPVTSDSSMRNTSSSAGKDKQYETRDTSKSSISSQNSSEGKSEDNKASSVDLSVNGEGGMYSVDKKSTINSEASASKADTCSVPKGQHAETSEQEVKDTTTSKTKTEDVLNSSQNANKSVRSETASDRDRRRGNRTPRNFNTQRGAENGAYQGYVKQDGGRYGYDTRKGTTNGSYQDGGWEDGGKVYSSRGHRGGRGRPRGRGGPHHRPVKSPPGFESKPTNPRPPQGVKSQNASQQGTQFEKPSAQPRFTPKSS